MESVIAIIVALVFFGMLAAAVLWIKGRSLPKSSCNKGADTQTEDLSCSACTCKKK